MGAVLAFLATLSTALTLLSVRGSTIASKVAPKLLKSKPKTTQAPPIGGKPLPASGGYIKPAIKAGAVGFGVTTAYNFGDFVSENKEYIIPIATLAVATIALNRGKK